MTWVRHRVKLWAVLRDVVFGGGVALAFVIAGGYLQFQGHAVEQGILFSWNLEPQFVTDPRVPVLQMAAAFFLSLLTLWLLYWRRISSSTSVTSVSAFVSLLVLACVSGVVANVPPPSVIEIAASGFGGVMSVGATSGATFAVAGAIAAFEIMQRQRSARSSPGTHRGTDADQAASTE